MKVMALDIGEKRIGIAMTDPLMMFVRPYATFERKNLSYNLKKVLDLVRDNEIECLVFGLPLDDDGKPTPHAKRIIDLKERVEAHLKHNKVNIRVDMFDETMTTRDAHEEMKNAGIKHSKRKTVIDKMAAVKILESWMQAEKEK